MDRMKTLLKYALWVILFFIFSEFLITVGLNSSYNDMKRKDKTSQVQIIQAQSTLVNGKIKGIIRNSESDNLNNKYVKIDFYSKRDNKVGTKYIEITTVKPEDTQEFSTNFELQDVTSYEISITDKKEEGEIEFISKELTKKQIVFATVITLLMFW